MNAKQIVKLMMEEADSMEAKAEALRALASEVEMLAERYQASDQAMEKIAVITGDWHMTIQGAGE